MNLPHGMRIKMFRAIVDPMIGPKPKNAFMLPDLPGWDAVLHESGNIYVKCKWPTTGKETFHVIGVGNWSSIELYPDEVVQDKPDIATRKRPKIVENPTATPFGG